MHRQSGVRARRLRGLSAVLRTAETVSSMHAINQRAAKVLAQLVAGLRLGDRTSARTIGGPRGGAIMPVSVECIGADLFSVAHYYEQNGDLMADPEMVFWRRGAAFYPVHFQQDNLGIYRECLWFDDAGGPARVAPKEQRDQAAFAGTWMRNIRAQQREWFAAVAAFTQHAANDPHCTCADCMDRFSQEDQ